MRFLLGIFLFAGFGAQSCRAEMSELQIKSAYVLNFIKFVEWPAEAIQRNSRINLCVIGSDELRTSLSPLNGRKAGEYEVRVIPPGYGVLSACHVLFIGDQEQRRFVSIIKSLGNAPVLTISDIPGFVERGGGIGLLIRNDKMVFEVNLASTRKADLRLSGQMLNLASNVIGNR